MGEKSSREAVPGSKNRQEDQKSWRQFAEYSGLAMAMPIAAVLGYVIGQWFDKTLGTSFLAVAGLLLGIAAGFVQLVSKAVRDGKSSTR